MSERLDKPLIFVPGPKAVPSGTKKDAGLRQTVRYPFTAAAEIIEVFSQTRVVGRISDLSQGGCYVDTLSPLAVGAIVRVHMDRQLRMFDAIAKVVYVHLSMGMGLLFTEIKPEHQAVLEAWLAELSGERMPEPDGVAGPETGLLSAVLNLREVLNELINLTIRKKIINENEGAALLRRMFR